MLILSQLKLTLLDNGFKPKSFQSRLGKLELQVPQTRDGDFYPSALERGERSERALKLAITEMYIQGVSTRKVAKITTELCGFNVTSTQVSRAAKLLDEELETWRNRPLGQVEYLILDARYEKSSRLGQRARLCGADCDRRSDQRSSECAWCVCVTIRSGSPLA
tara:strand:- start:610 stop:1101 length:492 start_codon:yes stop_codon:yes gene_type:complete